MSVYFPTWRLHCLNKVGCFNLCAKIFACRAKKTPSCSGLTQQQANISAAESSLNLAICQVNTCMHKLSARANSVVALDNDIDKCQACQAHVHHPCSLLTHQEGTFLAQRKILFHFEPCFMLRVNALSWALSLSLSYSFIIIIITIR